MKRTKRVVLSKIKILPICMKITTIITIFKGGLGGNIPKSGERGKREKKKKKKKKKKKREREREREGGREWKRVRKKGGGGMEMEWKK